MPVIFSSKASSAATASLSTCLSRSSLSAMIFALFPRGFRGFRKEGLSTTLYWDAEHLLVENLVGSSSKMIRIIFSSSSSSSVFSCYGTLGLRRVRRRRKRCFCRTLTLEEELEGVLFLFNERTSCRSRIHFLAALSNCFFCGILSFATFWGISSSLESSGGSCSVLERFPREFGALIAKSEVSEGFWELLGKKLILRYILTSKEWVASPWKQTVMSSL